MDYVSMAHHHGRGIDDFIDSVLDDIQLTSLQKSSVQLT